MKRRLAKRDWGLIALGIVLGLLVLLTGRLARDDASTVASSVAVRRAVHEVKAEVYRQDIETWHGRLAGCQRGKHDRTSIAAALRAQSDYLNLVLQAKSVQADVKRAARVNQRVQDSSAVDLESRTGANLRCREAYPKPPAPDGVKPLN